LNRYLVESPHSDEECLHALDLVVAAGHITHYDWGCEAGEHTGWVIIEAENESEALLSVPTFIRHKARAIQLTKFTPEIIHSFHQKNG
jgi:hypothetical protein